MNNSQRQKIVEDLKQCIKYCEDQHRSSCGEILEDLDEQSFKDMLTVVETLLED